MQSSKNKSKSAEKTSAEVMTFFSTATAVGKTILAINCAADLAERGYRVCVADFDLQFGDVCNYMNVNPTKTLYDYSLLDKERRNAKDFVLKTDFGFDILPCPNDLDEGFIMEAPPLVQAVGDLREAYDYVLVDTTTGFSGVNLALLEQTDVLYMPCVVDFIPSIKNLKLGLETLRKLQFDRDSIRLILNRNNSATMISVKDVEALLGRPFQYFISNDYQGMMKSIKEVRPVVLTEGKSKIADDISEMMASELGEQTEGGGLAGWLGSLWK